MSAESPTDTAAAGAPGGLIVPIDIVAFCVGEVDQHQATNGFAGTTTVYTAQVTTANQAFLGSNVTRSLADPPWQQLGAGVHLHWALPDALTKSAVVNGQLDFMAAPNRWLLTRYVVRGGTASTKSWVVESDALSQDPPAGQTAVTLPVTPASPEDQNYRYVGRWQEFSASWASEPSGIKDLTGSELTAVASGVVSFAAYYPDCRSVFGFWDQLSDVEVSGGEPAQLMYSVTGWYDDAANDPLNGGKSLADIQQLYAWTFDGDAAATPSYTLYNGVVQGVAWDPGKQYVYQQPSQSPIQAAVALGNNPAEALSAYFKYLDHPAEPLFEPLLNAFQMGLLSTFQQPQPNQLTQLYESLREQEFSTSDSGTLYTIVDKDSEGEPGDQEELIDLPPQLADDLNLLNIYQQQYDLCRAHMDEYRWQLFADWYRIFMADSGTQGDAFNVANYKYYWWSALAGACDAVSQNCTAQRAAVEAQLGDKVALKAVPAPRYYQPGEPVVLVESPDLAYPSRYGGDGDHDAEGRLRCRLTGQAVTALTADGTAISAPLFSGLALPTPNGLPHPDDCSALIVEAALLNTYIAAALSGAAEPTLRGALGSLLAGGEQSVYVLTAGQPPSPVGANWWDSNPWLPLFAYWTVSYLPLQPTTLGDDLVDYAAEFFTANYSVDTDSGGAISYSPDGSQYSIAVDPSAAAFPQTYNGQSLLQASPAEHFAAQLTDYLQTHTDATLSTILGQLQSSNILVQPLSGFNDLLLMRQQSLQLNVSAPAGSEYAQLTQAIAPVVGDRNHVGPQFNGFFNPVRAGYMKLSLTAVDAFGQRRGVEFPQLICAESMAAYDRQQQPVTSAAYLEPRIAQPARLLFRWLSADTTDYDEMNSHPAASPVCGWLLPNHLDGSFFLYNQQGRPLGSLALNGDRTAVVWQSAPGDDQTINQGVETVLGPENPQLLELALALQNGTPDFFADLWEAVDTVHGNINPQNLGSNSGLAVLVGRPVALVQASLRLEVQGTPAINQGWQTFTNGYAETDNNLTGVEFPVILGDFSQLDDGLVGYFKWNTSGTDYDLSTFYTEGADPQATSGVVRPSKTNLLLTATPKTDDIVMSPSARPAFHADDISALNQYAQKVLMLLDPRAPVNATAGILPTKSLAIPSDIAADALSTLEMSFLVTPVLSGAGGLALPIPPENGYQFSWVEEALMTGGGVAWAVTPEILDASGQAVWSYTPQQLTEGWLRLNPSLLEFALLNGAGQPSVTAGAPDTLSLVVTNRKPASITLTPGQLLAEGQANGGSIFYIHLGALVAQADVPNVRLAADGWSFQNFSSTRYGQYWAATPTQPVSLAQGDSFSISVADLVPAAGAAQAQVYFDYYNVSGISDGVYEELLAVQSDGGQ